MAQRSISSDQLHPTNPEIQQATMNTLQTEVPEAEVQEFLNQAESASTPAPIGATVNLKLAVWGKLQVDPDGKPWKYDHTAWGGPGYIGSAVGFLYTAYDSWDAFFQNATSFHVQGIDAGGGILQVNWFNKSGTPVGQFNGAAGGVGAVEGGGSGKWQHK